MLLFHHPLEPSLEFGITATALNALRESGHLCPLGHIHRELRLSHVLLLARRPAARFTR